MPRRSPRYDGAGLGAASPPVQIPRHTQDPIWSLRPWPVELELAGRVWEFPAVPAADWLSVLMAESPDLEQLLLDLCPDGMELLFDASVEPDVLYDGLLALVEQVASRRWWIALRLIGVVRTNWNTLGVELMEAGIDAEKLSLSAWLDAALVITLRVMDPKETTLFITRLEMPPPEEMAAEQERVEEMEMSVEQFLSMG